MTHIKRLHMFINLIFQLQIFMSTFWTWQYYFKYYIQIRYAHRSERLSSWHAALITKGMINVWSIGQLRVLACVPDPLRFTFRDGKPFTKIRGLKITPNFWQKIQVGLSLCCLLPKFSYICSHEESCHEGSNGSWFNWMRKTYQLSTNHMYKYASLLKINA